MRAGIESANTVHPIDRLPPHNAEAEECVLGSILLAPDFMQAVAAMLTPDDFYQAKHRPVWRAMLSLHRAQRPPDHAMVTDELQRQGAYEPGMLARYIDAVPAPVHAEQYAAIVRRCAIKRRLIEATGRIAAVAYDDSVEVEMALAQAMEELNRVQLRVDNGQIRKSADSAHAFREYLIELGEGKSRSIRTGFDLDYMTDGAQPTMLWVVGGYTSQGKSALMQSMARRMAKAGHEVLYASTEMSDEELMKRDISAFLRRDWVQDLKPKYMAGDIHTIKEICRALDYLEGCRPTVFTKGAMTTADIRREAAKMQATKGLDVVFVDYLQDLSDAPVKHNSNRYQDVAAMAKALKAMAIDLRIPVIMGAQFGRSVAERSGHVPTRSDFRESGDIENSVDVAIGINRPAAWDDAHPGADEREAWLYLLKNRGGKAGPKFRVEWVPDAAEFCERTRGMD